MAPYYESGRVHPVESKFHYPLLLLEYRKLQERFRREAVVVDHDTGFIRVAFMNKAPDIDPNALSLQAQLIAQVFRYSFPTHIIGIPESGLPLTREVSRQFPGAKLVRSAKENGEPNPDLPNRFSTHSFTQQKDVTICTERIDPHGNYLIIDDVVAHGNVAESFINELVKYRAHIVGLGVGFDKLFQGGMERIARLGDEYQFPIASLISITGISPDNRVILADK